MGFGEVEGRRVAVGWLAGLGSQVVGVDLFLNGF